MDLWMQIAAAGLMGVMVILLFPRAREMIKSSPKGSSAEWLSAIIPLGLVVLFIFLLVKFI